MKILSRLTSLQNPVASDEPSTKDYVDTAVKTVWVPIALQVPRVSTLAGNSFWNPIALTNVDDGHWEFLKDVDGKLYGKVIVPKNLGASPTAKIILVTRYNATSGVSSWQVSSKNAADGVTLNPSLTAETRQDITAPGTARLRKDVTFTLTNQPAAGDVLFVEVFHNGVHVNDTVAVNSELLFAILEVKVT